MTKHNWSEWVPHTTGKQPVADEVPVQWLVSGEAPNKFDEIVRASKDLTWLSHIKRYRFDLNHPDAPKEPESDLSWLARNELTWNPPRYAVSVSGESLIYKNNIGFTRYCGPQSSNAKNDSISCYTRAQWQAERQRLGLEPKEPVRQYYFKDSSCPASLSTDQDCICWHDTGAGPFPDDTEESSLIDLEWRDKPMEQPANHLLRDEYDQAFAPIEWETPKLPDEAKAVPVEITGQESDVMLIAKAFGIADIPRYTILASLLGGESLERVNAWVMRAREVE